MAKPHKKAHLPRGVELEKRRYIGFARTPVEDQAKVFASGVKAESNYYLYRRPWVDNRKPTWHP